MNLISACCGADVREEHKMSFRDHHEAIPIYVCENCGNECEVEDVKENEMEKLAEISLDN